MDSLSDRLIDNIRAIAEFVEPNLDRTTAAQLLGDDAAPLLKYLYPEVIVSLAFISGYLEVIYLAFDEDGFRESYDLVDDFVGSALGYFQKHLEGWDEDED